MWSPRQRNQTVRLFGKRLMLVALFVFAVGACFSVWRVYEKDRESLILRKEAEIQLEDLTQRQDQLAADIARLQTDRGIEEQLRQQYALAAEGEQLIVIVEPPESEPIKKPTTLMERIKKALGL